MIIKSSAFNNYLTSIIIGRGYYYYDAIKQPLVIPFNIEMQTKCREYFWLPYYDPALPILF